MLTHQFNLNFSLYPKAGTSWEVLIDFEGANFEIPLKKIVQNKFKSILPTSEQSDIYSNDNPTELNALAQKVTLIQKALVPTLKKATAPWERDFEWKNEWYVKTQSQTSWLFDCMKMLQDMILYASKYDVYIEIRLGEFS